MGHSGTAGTIQRARTESSTTEEIKAYVADFRSFLCEGTVPERKALIRNFVKGIEVTGNEALDFVQSGLPRAQVTRNRVPVRSGAYP